MPTKAAPKKAASKKAASKKAAPKKAAPKKVSSRTGRHKDVALLSGGNPQIPKGDGEAPVDAYIAAMPDWKHQVGRRLDALIVESASGVQKAVRWNSPFYGMPGRGWFVSFHCFTKYVKVTFLRGTKLRPPPPGASKSEYVAYLDVHEGDELDEVQFRKWIKQAAKLPGDPLF